MKKCLTNVTRETSFASKAAKYCLVNEMFGKTINSINLILCNFFGKIMALHFPNSREIKHTYYFY